MGYERPLAISGDDHVTQTETEQLRTLIDAHGRALALYARQWCSDPDDALQEALIELLRQSTAPDNPVGWLYKTVRRRAQNMARSEKRRAKHQRRAGEQRELWSLPVDEALDAPVDLQQVLTQLPQLEREIVVARIWGERSFGEIAELVGRTTSSVHRRYQRALTELGKIMNRQSTPSRQTDEPRPSVT